MESFAEKARRVINENQELFTALEDLDRTGKLRKIRYKEKATFTLDEELMNRFRAYCIKNNVKMSNKLEGLIKGLLENKTQN